MEGQGVLDADNEVHLFCLHYIYLQRIDAALVSFTNAWNNHPIRTERNLTPIQLWISGLSRQSDDPEILTGVRICAHTDK